MIANGYFGNLYQSYERVPYILVINSNIVYINVLYFQENENYII